MRRLQIIELLAVIASLGGCSGARRVDATKDVLVLHGTDPVEAPLRAVGWFGKPTTLLHLSWSSSDSTVARGRDGSVRCLREGDARIRVTGAQRPAEFTVRCDLQSRVQFEFGIVLDLGAAPHPLSVAFERPDGRVEPVREVRWIVRDERIAQVRHDSLVAIAPGSTRIEADLGGLKVRSPVSVYAVVSTDTLELAPGAFHNWPLSPGRYAVTMYPLDGDRRMLALEGTGLTCSKDARRDDTMHCLVREAGALSMRNADARGAARRVWVRVIRAP